MANNGVFKSESLKKMVFPRVFSTPVVHNDIIYVVGGCDQMGTPVDSFEMYDISKKKWTTLQNMPTKRAAPAVGLVGDTLVAIGGVGDVQQPVDAIEAYSIKDKKWTQLESLPSGLLGMSSVLREGKVYVMGGMGTDTNPHDFFRMIDVEENKWKELKAMPTPRYATFSFLINDQLYVIGGRVGKAPCLAFEVYNFTTDTWRKLPDVPSKRVFAMYIATDTHILSVGGLIQPGNKGFSDACEVFDLQTEQWKIGQSMPTRRGDFAIGVLEGRVVCAGGLGNAGKPHELIEIYDIETDTWSKGKDMHMSHCSCAYITHKGKLYVIGGLSAQGPTNCVQCISYVTEEEENKAQKSQQARGGKKKQT